MGKRNYIPLTKIVTVTSKTEHFETHDHIYSEVFCKEVIYKTFGIPFYRYIRDVVSDSKLLEKDGKPIGFKDKQSNTSR